MGKYSPEQITVLEYNSKYTREKGIDKAHEKKGECYHLLTRNCEHFVTEARTGIKQSSQIQSGVKGGVGGGVSGAVVGAAGGLVLGVIFEAGTMGFVCGGIIGAVIGAIGGGALGAFIAIKTATVQGNAKLSRVDTTV